MRDPASEPAIAAALEAAGLLTIRQRSDGGKEYVLMPEGAKVAQQLAMSDEAGMAELLEGLLGPEES